MQKAKLFDVKKHLEGVFKTKFRLGDGDLKVNVPSMTGDQLQELARLRSSVELVDDFLLKRSGTGITLIVKLVTSEADSLQIAGRIKR